MKLSIPALFERKLCLGQDNMSAAHSTGSLLWSRDSKTLAELIEAYPLPDDRSLLVKVQCRKVPCYCALENNEVLMVKPIPNVTLVCATWMKYKAGNFNSRNNSPNCVKSARLVMTHHNSAWYEVLNESGQSIPCWNGMKDVIRYRPRSFLLRKDIKCLLTRNGSGSGEFELQSNSTGIVKAGTVLNFLEYNKFRVLKHRKVKDIPLVKCSDTSGHLIFLNVDDKCPLSPIAGPDNISGVHTLRSLLQKFHLPISIRPVFGSPISWLPNSDRHYLRLNACYRGDLLLIGTLRNPDHFFVVTPSMLEDHTFRVGDSELPLHSQMLEKYASRVLEFLTICHPHESLRYLFRNLQDITNQSALRVPAPPAISRDPTSASLKHSPSHHAENGVLRTKPVSIKGEHARRASQLSSEETDRLFDEVEDIYYYVRTGRFPDRSRSASSGSSLALINPRTRQVEIVPDPPSAHSAGADVHHTKSRSPAGSAPRPRRMSSSCNNLMEDEAENRRPTQGRPPPLPPRNYSIEDVEAPFKRHHHPHQNGHVSTLRVTAMTSAAVAAVAEEERRRFSADCAPMQLRLHMQNTLF